MVKDSKREGFPQANFVHSITYTNEGKIPVSDIAESLLANEQLIKLTAPLLETLFPGLVIEGIEVHFKNASHDSPLKEAFGIALFATFQKDLEKEVPQLIEHITGKPVPDSYDSLITVMAFIILYFGADYVFNRFKGGKSKAIAEGYNQTINVAGDYIGIPIETLKEATQKTFKGSRLQSLARATKSIIAPAKRDKKAEIIGGNELTFTSESVQDFPNEIDFEYEEDLEKQEALQNVRIGLRATDLDKNTTGWAGVIKRISDARLKMEIYPTIDLQKLHGKKSITGDIILVSRKQKDGEYKPTSFHLIGIHEPKRRTKKR